MIHNVHNICCFSPKRNWPKKTQPCHRATHPCAYPRSRRLGGFMALVGCLNHLERYEFVNGKDDIPHMKWKIKAMFETTNQGKSHTSSAYVGEKS